MRLALAVPSVSCSAVPCMHGRGLRKCWLLGAFVSVVVATASAAFDWFVVRLPPNLDAEKL